MAYNYQEKSIKLSRRQFLGLSGICAAVLWTGAYSFTDIFIDRNKYIKMRAQGLYSDDQKCAFRQSHNNPSLNRMYKDFIGAPMNEFAEELFHTSYVNRTLL